MTTKHEVTEREARDCVVLLLGALLGQQLERHRRDRWKRKIKDALWPLL